MHQIARSFLLLLPFLLPASPLRAQSPLPQHAPLFRPVFQIDGEYVNDHCLIYAKGRWHLYFIRSAITGSWGHATSEIAIGHASSADLLTWENHAPAVEIGPRGSLDGGHVYAPSVIEDRGRYVMLYTGNPGSYDTGEHLLMATSTDLHTWTKVADTAAFAPDSSWATWYPRGYGDGLGGPRSGRDPHLYRDAHTSLGTICYYVTRLKGDSTRPSRDDEYAAIGAASTHDFVTWIDHGPVLTRRTKGDDVYGWGHPESPCLVRHGDRYYLFWKSGVGIRYAISDNPLDFHDRDAYLLTTAHASEIVEWNGRWYITSCSRDVDDIEHSWTDRSRGLSLAGLRWEGRHPVVTALPDSTAPAPGRTK